MNLDCGISSGSFILYCNIDFVMSDPLVDPPPVEPTDTAIILSSTPPSEPPPPYPSRERRNRAHRHGRRRRELAVETTHQQAPSTGTESDLDGLHGQPFPESDDERVSTAAETTPLLSHQSSPRLLHGGIGGRQRTLSITSTLQSSASIAPSFAQTILSAFNPERDADLDPECDIHDADAEPSRRVDISPTQFFSVEREPPLSEHVTTRPRRMRSCWSMLGRYFRPVMRKAYYSALFHLLVLNFPYALVAWIYLFVFTLVRLHLLLWHHNLMSFE